MKISLRTAFAALGVLALVGTGLVGQADSAAAGTSTHFQASWSGSVKVVLPDKFVFAGTGTSDPMGPITARAVATLQGLSLECLAGHINTNVVVLTAADGTLTLTSHDVGCLTGVGTFHGTGVYTVTGGTGRYQGATGNGTLDGRADIIRSTSAIVADGTLTVP